MRAVRAVRAVMAIRAIRAVRAVLAVRAIVAVRADVLTALASRRRRKRDDPCHNLPFFAVDCEDRAADGFI
jgi:hypothetical protein